MLTNQGILNLSWSSDFNYPNLIRIRTIPDGSCYFHAIVSAFFKPYIVGYLDGKPLNRSEFIRDLRRELAENLDQYYPSLARGEFLRSEIAECSLDSMKATLNSYEPVNELFDEYISNILDKDIYVLDNKTQDVYMNPDRNTGLLYKDRKSIVILDLHGHYELIGEYIDGQIKTHFMPEDPLIVYIKKRLEK